MTPDEFLALAEQYAEEAGTALLFSGGDYRTAKRSFLHIRPTERVYVEAGVENPWEKLKQQLTLDGMPWIGYIAYEMGQQESLTYPVAYFQRGGTLVEYDHATGQLVVQGELPAPRRGNARINSSVMVRRLDKRAAYIEKILQAKELILDGEIYQVNLSHSCQYSGIHNPFLLYQQLLENNPVPFSAYLKVSDQFSIVSMSPERLLRHQAGHLESCPIKGTAPRGKNPIEDAQRREQLLTSPKERAELLMITDLMRNDLGKVSKAGSVKTPELCICEGYSSVYHLHSVVRSEALESLHPLDLLEASFPGGSITGCPKSSAMQTIRSLEQRPRGIYTGSIGYISGNGNFDFNIAIRTMAIEGGVATLSLGGGIVADSDPDLEYEETLHKGHPFFSLLSGK